MSEEAEEEEETFRLTAVEWLEQQVVDFVITTVYGNLEFLNDWTAAIISQETYTVLNGTTISILWQVFCFAIGLGYTTFNFWYLL